MAYSNLQKFYKKEEQRQLMVYLSRRGMICRELKDLTWDKVINGQVLKASLLRKKKIKLSKNLAREIHRLKWQITNSVVPPIKVFYKEMPNEKTGVGGAEFDIEEIRRICGEPHEMLLTKLKYFATMKITKAFITIKEL